MSKKQVTAFFEEISKNNNLANEVEKVAGGKNSNEVKAKELILLAQKHHFNFTQEEAADAQLTLKKTLSPEKNARSEWWWRFHKDKSCGDVIVGWTWSWWLIHG